MNLLLYKAEGNSVVMKSCQIFCFPILPLLPFNSLKKSFIYRKQHDSKSTGGGVLDLQPRTILYISFFYHFF